MPETSKKRAVKASEILHGLLTGTKEIRKKRICYRSRIVARQNGGLSNGPLVTKTVSADLGFPITVDLEDQTIERYYVAVSSSGIRADQKDDSTRYYSGWSLYCDASGVPLAVSTAQASVISCQ